MVRRRVGTAVLLLAGCVLAWYGLAGLRRCGDVTRTFGWPLLIPGLTAGITGTASMLPLGATARRRLAISACLASAVPFVVMVALIWRAPEHGELGGLLILPLLGCAITLTVIAIGLGLRSAATVGPRRLRVWFVLAGCWLGAAALPSVGAVGLLRIAGIGDFLRLQLMLALSGPAYAILSIPMALRGTMHVSRAIVLWAAIVVGGLVGAVAWRIRYGRRGLRGPAERASEP